MSVLSLCFPCEKNSWNSKLFGDPICPFSTCWVKRWSQVISAYGTKKSVLRTRIQDPVLFWPLDPACGMEKSWSGIRGPRSGINIPDHISQRVVKIFWVQKNNILVNSVLRIWMRDSEHGKIQIRIKSRIHNTERNKHENSARSTNLLKWNK